MSTLFKLPLEQQGRDEAEVQRITWNRGPFNFLLTRTIEKYNLKANMVRREKLEHLSGLSFPLLSDEVLLALYRYASSKYIQNCNNRYENTGFSTTYSEKCFLSMLESIIKNNPKLKHLEIYPSPNFSKDLPQNFKMVVGNRVPDFVIFGLKTKGNSAVAIEIDGDSHVDKYEKDVLRNKQLKELGIFVLEIPNAQVKDDQFLTKAILSLYRLRNGSLNAQIQRTKRAIWVKTVACQLSLQSIEEYVRQNFSIQLNLRREAIGLVSMSTCPRKIKRELKDRL